MKDMKRIVGLVSVLLCLGVADLNGAVVDLPRYPSISPDGKWVVFSWRGDLWKVVAKGGHAERMTSHGGDETYSAWSGDGKRVAFNSTRSGFNVIHMMNADGSGIRRVTNVDRSVYLSGFGVDDGGKEVVTFSSWLEDDVYRSPRPFMMSVEGGDVRRVHDAFGARPVVSPNGRYVLFTRGRSTWSRRGYRGSGARDVWLYDRKERTFKRLTTFAGNDGAAQWLNDRRVVFLSDRWESHDNLFLMDVGVGENSVQRLTGFKDRDVSEYGVARGAGRIVMAAWDKLYLMDVKGDKGTVKAMVIHGNEDEGDRRVRLNVSRRVSEARLSPDGKTMAYVAYGEVFVRGMASGSRTVRVTKNHAREADIAWAPDGLTLYFTSDMDGTLSIYGAKVVLTRGELKRAFDKRLNPPVVKKGFFETLRRAGREAAAKAKEKTRLNDAGRWADAMRFEIKPVMKGETHDSMGDPSPDGRRLAFKRGRGDLMVMELATRKVKKLVSSWDVRIGWSWRPDGTQIAYAVADLNFNYDIWIANVKGDAGAVNVTRHPDNDFNPQWSADGKVLSFLSERVEDEYDVWMVRLDPDLKAMTSAERKAYYEKRAKAAKAAKPRTPGKALKWRTTKEEWGVEKAYLRLRRVSSFRGSESNNAMTPAGDYYFYTGGSGSGGLYMHKWDGKVVKRLHGAVRVQHVSLKGDKVVFIENGRVGTVSTAGSVAYLDMSATIDVDLAKQSSQKFKEAARILELLFYHPTMKGLDWGKLTKRYHELAKRARTADEFNDVAARFIGELNGSHLTLRTSDGVSGNGQAMGRLGISGRREGIGYRVTRVLEEGPGGKGKMKLLAGDLITKIEFKGFGKGDTLMGYLEGRVGKETVVSVRRKVKGKIVELDLLLTPMGWRESRSMRYRDWRRANAAKVEKLTGGNVGYIHIQSMNQSSLDVFERDLYAAAEGKAGLIIDVRNNGGGWTTDRLLASIMYRRHAYTIPRGAGRGDKTGYPQDRLFIQRYTLPINVLCNENSFSNAEIFSHAFKTLKRGKLIGKTTYGGVISTGRTTLIDGTMLSLPFRGWYLPDDTDMENNGAVPDIRVPQLPGDEAKGIDKQLETAAMDLVRGVRGKGKGKGGKNEPTKKVEGKKK